MLACLLGISHHQFLQPTTLELEKHMFYKDVRRLQGLLLLHILCLE